YDLGRVIAHAPTMTASTIGAMIVMRRYRSMMVIKATGAISAAWPFDRARNSCPGRGSGRNSRARVRSSSMDGNARKGRLCAAADHLQRLESEDRDHSQH